MVDATEFPLSTVVMCCYNSEHFLERSIGSILNQTYPKVELIVMDDGSSDGSLNKAKGYVPSFEKKGYFLKVYHQKNQGPGYAAINGLRYATGKYLSFLDSDDALLPTSIERRVKALEENPSINIVRTNGYKVYEGETTVQRLIVENDQEKSTQTLFDDIIVGTANNFAGTFMVRAEAVRKFYGNQPIPYSDYGQNLQLILPGAYHSQQFFVDEPLMEYYIYQNTHSHKKTTEDSIRMYEGWYHLRKSIVECFAKDKEALLVRSRQLCVKNILSSIVGGNNDMATFNRYYMELQTMGNVDMEWKMYHAMLNHSWKFGLYRCMFFVRRLIEKGCC